MLKKVISFIAVCAMVMSMSATAFAANPSSDNTMTIDKNLKVTNPTLTSVDGPGLTYNYAIAPETPSADNGGTSITDSDNHTSVVTIGPVNGVSLSTASVSWPKGTAVDASATGADNIKSITATADITKFTAPGIYRYKITESSNPANPSTIGVTDADAAEIRYLDVYIENDTNGLKVAGVVMHDGTTKDGAPAQKKSFDASQFDTKNLEVKKAVTGGMADKNNQFPFVASVTNDGRYYYDGKGADASSATSKNTGASSSTTLANGESFWICGLSKTATVNVAETNNTQDTYATSVSGMATVVAANVAPSATKESGNVTISDNGQILFTNHLDTVSPTGVIMRFGPYVGMVLIAGLLLFMRRRTSKAAE